MQLSEPRKKSLVNLTPLIDVVFILLIFFMLASNFIRWNYIELSVGEVNELELDYDSISMITLHGNGLISLNEKTLTLKKIVSIVRNRVRVDINHPIIVQPEQGTTVQPLVDVLNQLQDFAGANISIAKSEIQEK